ncbi:hypothetical protein CBR_g48275 [Chara braunii]|uniref:D-lactate dehydrogenase (cytochrome) n=1 Tax=Chara braunii TaxID=69332 RepID=A0A388M2I0_CHABU|nr:hypothetical protein CBR_g48275 [Chara braunii]|eukprot:GBG88746.1 hypothetical protein CBR_g48275 [Chara braunii]
MAGSAILCTRRISVRSSPAIRYLTGHREGRSREFYGGGSGVRRGRWWLVEGSSGSDDATWTNCRQIGTVNEPRPLGSLCAPVAAAAERAMPGSRPYNPVCQSAAYVPMQLVIPNLGGDPDQVRDQGCSDRAGGRRGRNPIGSVLLAAFGGALGALQTLRLCEAEGQQYSGERHEHIAARLPPSLIIDLQAILGDGDRVVTDDEECKVHAIPWNSYHDSPACPGAVVNGTCNLLTVNQNTYHEAKRAGMKLQLADANFSPPQHGVCAKVVVVDARQHMLGRLSSILTKELLNGQKVVVVRCEEITLSGGLVQQKMKFLRFLRKRMNMKPIKGPIHFRSPSRILWRTIRGMVPRKTKRGAEALDRLKVYEGVPSPYDRMKKMVIPDALKVLHLAPGHKFSGLDSSRARLAGITARPSILWRPSVVQQEVLVELVEEQKQILAALQARRPMMRQPLYAVAPPSVAGPLMTSPPAGPSFSPMFGTPPPGGYVATCGSVLRVSVVPSTTVVTTVPLSSRAQEWEERRRRGGRVGDNSVRKQHSEEGREGRDRRKHIGMLLCGNGRIGGFTRSFDPGEPSADGFGIRSTEEVLEIVKTCARYKVPLIPYGGGTSLEGHTTTPKGGVSIDMNQMKAIKRLSVEDMDVTVEPGIGWIELNAFLRPYGLFFPLDPGPGATIGGMCATRCSGSLAVRYGTMRDNVISIKAVTANGDVVKTASRARKSSAGYDLTRLLIGSEGTLGVITEITLKLQRIPEASTVAMCTFPSIKDAADVAIATMHAGIQVSRVELLDEVMIKGLNIGSGRSLPERPTLMFEFIGTESSVKEQTKCVEGIVSAHGGSNFVFAESAAEKEALWRMRKEALWSAATLKPESEPMVTVGEHRQAHFHSYLSSFFVNSLDSSYTKEANNSFESYLLP